MTYMYMTSLTYHVGSCDAACAALSGWRQGGRLAEMEHGSDDFLCRHDLRWFRYV